MACEHFKVQMDKQKLRIHILLILSSEEILDSFILQYIYPFQNERLVERVGPALFIKIKWPT